MKKEIKQFDVDYTINWGYGVEISKIEADLKALKEIGATHIDIDTYESYGYSYLTIEPKCQRLETDEEFHKRNLKEEQRKKITRDLELKKLEELKLKYEKKL